MRETAKWEKSATNDEVLIVALTSHGHGLGSLNEWSKSSWVFFARDSPIIEFATLSLTVWATVFDLPAHGRECRV